MVDIRQTPEYANYLSKIVWGVERVDGVNYFVRKFPLIGSLIKIQRPEQLDIKTVGQFGKKHRAFQVIVEPISARQLDSLATNSFRRSKSPFLPSKTLHLDLTKSKGQLLKGMKKDARSALRRANNIELKRIENSNGIEEFRKVWKKAVGWKRYVPPLKQLVALKESFGDNCLFLCSATLRQNAGLPRQSEASAGAIFLVADKTGYYWQAFTGAQGRKLNAQSRIVWEGILWAKKRGAKVFDFEGIYDARFPDKSWLGFTHFKKSFGGYEVEYPGAFVLNRLPF